MFTDRTDAGRQVADAVTAADIHADIVLAIPRGGLPVGRAVADALDIPLDIVSARKIGAPGNPELAIGAVASDGTQWLNESLIEEIGVGEEYVATSAEREREAARAKVQRYRGDRPPLDLAGKQVLIVDDGVATGATTTACIRQVAAAGASRIVLAIPVAPRRTIERLRTEVDEVICVEIPSSFGAVGQFYDSFAQVPDERAKEYLTDE